MEGVYLVPHPNQTKPEHHLPPLEPEPLWSLPRNSAALVTLSWKLSCFSGPVFWGGLWMLCAPAQRVSGADRVTSAPCLSQK